MSFLSKARRSGSSILESTFSSFLASMIFRKPAMPKAAYGVGVEVTVTVTVVADVVVTVRKLVMVALVVVVVFPLPKPAAWRSPTENDAIRGIEKAAPKTSFFSAARRAGSTSFSTRSNFSSFISFVPQTRLQL